MARVAAKVAAGGELPAYRAMMASIWVVAVILAIMLCARAALADNDEGVGQQLAQYSDGLPAGNWRNYCTNGRMRGNELKALCRRANGSMHDAEGNIKECGAAGANYNPYTGQFVCAASSNGGGYGSNDGLPVGNWRNYCSNGRMQGNELKAMCRRANGSVHDAEGNVRECGSQGVNYNPYTGQFVCVSWGQGGGQGGNYGNFPPGSWSQSCSNASMQGSVLRAQCRNSFGQSQYAQIDASRCYSGVWNDNGRLRCQ